MQAQLTSSGFIKRSPSEIKADLVSRLQLALPEFKELDIDIQNNLLDTAIQPIMQFEDLTTLLLNCYSPSYSNDAIFLRFAESVGLRAKSAFKSQTVLTFSGKFGDVIPKGVEVKNGEQGSIVYVTDELVVIGTTGEVSVLAYSENGEALGAGELNTLKTLLQNGIAVTNKTATLEYLEEESISELKRRAQNKFRSARLGGRLYAESLIKSIDGVDPRLVAFYTSTENQTDALNPNIVYATTGIEAVVGGGKDEEVALALFKAYLETQKLISAPSQDDEDRRILVQLYIYNNPVKVYFTRPKLLNLELQLGATFFSSISTPTAVEYLTRTAITEYVNTLTVGTTINSWSLTQIITKLFETNGIPSHNIKQINWKYRLDSEANFKSFDSDNKIPELEKDCYAILKSYSVVLNA